MIFRNWKQGWYEVDIIAIREDVLHYIKVKSRHDDLFGKPEDWVDRKKGIHFMSAGVAFQQKYPTRQRVQKDILFILLTPGSNQEFFFIEDVYWW